jgi:hypothetical protein
MFKNILAVLGAFALVAVLLCGAYAGTQWHLNETKAGFLAEHSVLFNQNQAILKKLQEISPQKCM